MPIKLCRVLETLTRLIATHESPFFSDNLFQKLNAVTGKHKVESVHHADYPVANIEAMDESLEERMQLAQDACWYYRFAKVNIKVRQPYKSTDTSFECFMKVQLQKGRFNKSRGWNVKEVEYLDPDNNVYPQKIKPNSFWHWVKTRADPGISAALAQFTQEDRPVGKKRGSI